MITFERVYIPSIELQNAINAAKDKSCTREIMARFYADCIRCSTIHGLGSIDWKTLNAAIVNRWPRGLEYIKSLARKIGDAR